MNTKKVTRSAVFASFTALLLCASMLVATTFAWFTDSVTSANNKIQSGTLKVDLELLEKQPDGTTAWNSIKDSRIPVFSWDNWEPGYTDVKVFKIENEGSLALRWVAKFACKKQLTALADAIDVYVKPSETELAYPADRSLDGYTRVGTAAEFINSIKETTKGELAPGEEAYLGIALKMQENAGNEYQGLDLGAPFDIQIRAIQQSAEPDSFGPDYDANLEPVNAYVSNPADLKTAMLEVGGYIKLQNDIVVDSTTPAQYGTYMFLANGREVTIDLNGHDIIATEDTPTNISYLFTTANGGKLNIVGEGKLEAKNKVTGICRAMNANDQINIYGGVYQVNGENWSIAMPCLYTNSGSIDVYGGKFYGVGHWIANAEDKQGNRLSIVFHEGVLFENESYQQGDNTRVKLAEGCTLAAEEIDGKTWYRVVKGIGVSNAEELTDALKTEGAQVVLTGDLALSSPVTIDKDVTLNLNNKTLTTMGLNFAGGVTIENGTIKSGGNTNMVPHFQVSGGELTMNNVTVDVNHHLNNVSGYSEAAGMDISNATAVLNNCDIKISNETAARWVFSYGVSLFNANLTMNGGSITAKCVAGTAANGPTNPNAISSMGACTATLNNVNVDAMYYAATVRGHLTLNTTDRSVTSANIVDNNGGSHTINYIG